MSDHDSHWTLVEPDVGYCVECTLEAWLADGSRCLDCLHKEQEQDERDIEGAAHGSASTSPATAERCSAEREA